MRHLDRALVHGDQSCVSQDPEHLLDVFVLSYGTFWAIKRFYGLRVSAEEEDAGLDISEHGMYGYPEQFIPAPELIGYEAPPVEVAAELGRTGRAATATPGSVQA